MGWTLQILSASEAATERQTIDATEEHVIDLPGARITFGARDGIPAALVELGQIAVIGVAAPVLDG